MITTLTWPHRSSEYPTSPLFELIPESVRSAKQRELTRNGVTAK